VSGATLFGGINARALIWVFVALTFTCCVALEQAAAMVQRAGSASQPVVLVEPLVDAPVSPMTQTAAPRRASLAVEAPDPHVIF
jgi:hypothetical protein